MNLTETVERICRGHSHHSTHILQAELKCIYLVPEQWRRRLMGKVGNCHLRFGRLVNPIWTRRGRMCPLYILLLVYYSFRWLPTSLNREQKFYALTVNCISKSRRWILLRPTWPGQWSSREPQQVSKTGKTEVLPWFGRSVHPKGIDYAQLLVFPG